MDFMYTTTHEKYNLTILCISQNRPGQSLVVE